MEEYGTIAENGGFKYSRVVNVTKGNDDRRDVTWEMKKNAPCSHRDNRGKNASNIMVDVEK